MAQPPRSYRFGYLVGKSDVEGMLECEEKCYSEPLCQSYTFISNSNWVMVWKGECLGTNDEDRVREPDEYALSGSRTDCGLVGETL